MKEEQRTPDEYNWFSHDALRYYSALEVADDIEILDQQVQVGGLTFDAIGLAIDNKHGSYDLPINIKSLNTMDLPTQTLARAVVRASMDDFKKIKTCNQIQIVTHFYEDYLSIDLTQNVDKLKKSLRKSYKSLVNKQDNVHVVQPDQATHYMEACRLLHAKVSGKISRPLRSWNIMAKSVERGSATLIISLEGTEVLGYCFFYSSQTTAYYGSSVMLDRRGAHPLIWRAISELKSKSIANLILDTGNNFTKFTEKELNIKKFKSGFGGQKFQCVLADIRISN